MSRTLALAAALGVLVACAASAQPRPQASAAPVASFDDGVRYAPVSCDIRVTRTAHGARFVALASADDLRTVDYELVITKRDRGGSSDIVQAGAVDLDADNQRLGEAEISLERGGSFEAQLVLSESGDTVCEAEQLS